VECPGKLVTQMAVVDTLPVLLKSTTMSDVKTKTWQMFQVTIPRDPEHGQVEAKLREYCGQLTSDGFGHHLVAYDGGRCVLWVLVRSATRSKALSRVLTAPNKEVKAFVYSGQYVPEGAVMMAREMCKLEKYMGTLRFCPPPQKKKHGELFTYEDTLEAVAKWTYDEYIINRANAKGKAKAEMGTTLDLSLLTYSEEIREYFVRKACVVSKPAALSGCSGGGPDQSQIRRTR
jgi:hypothetical protein